MLDLKQQRVLITGGGGFLGRHVCAKLADMGVEMWAPSHAEADANYFESTGSIGAAFADYSPTVVIHLAAKCGGIGANQSAPADMIKENLSMGINVIELCRGYEAKLVLLGTVCSYPKHCPVPFKESELWNGYPEETNAPYGIAKRAMFEMARAYHQQYGLKCACLLPANLYGPGDNFDLKTSHVIPAMIRKFVEARTGDEVFDWLERYQIEGTSKRWSRVKLWGSGKPTREFLYVEDAADAILRAAQLVDGPEPINIGCGIETPIEHLAIRIESEVLTTIPGAPVIHQWDKSKPNGQPRRCLDTSRAKELLGWEAKTSLEDGLRKTIDWYLEHRKELVAA